VKYRLTDCKSRVIPQKYEAAHEEAEIQNNAVEYKLQ